MSERKQTSDTKNTIYGAYAQDLKIYDKYLGKKVVMEIGEIGNKVSIGDFVTHGFGNVYLRNCFTSGESLSDLLKIVNELSENRKPSLVNFPLKRESFILNRTISKSQIASIQSLEDVFGEIKFEQVFK